MTYLRKRRLAVLPGPGDGDRNARALDVYEQRLAVGRERRAGELGPVQRVPPEPRHLAFGRHAQEMLLRRVLPAGVVLAEEQVAPGGDGDVVAILAQVVVVGLDEQLELVRRRGLLLAARPLVGAGHVAPDLAAPCRAAAGAGEVDAVLPVPHPLAAGESRAALQEAGEPEAVL